MNGWVLNIIGILFCIAGVFLFQRNAFEEHRSVRLPVLVILMGVVLITVGTAKIYKLIN